MQLRVLKNDARAVIPTKAHSTDVGYDLTIIDVYKKNMRDILIELYVIKMKNKYLLSVAQAGQLLSVILIAIIFKVITSKDIEFENGCITHINGIDFEQHKFVMERNFQKVEVSFSSCIIIDKKLMSDNWEKYIKDLKKISEKDLL